MNNSQYSEDYKKALAEIERATRLAISILVEELRDEVSKEVGSMTDIASCTSLGDYVSASRQNYYWYEFNALARCLARSGAGRRIVNSVIEEVLSKADGLRRIKLHIFSPGAYFEICE